jgi:tartrate/fumarate subfamily iron-sulfur-dependent hydro-lyase alpha chain
MGLIQINIVSLQASQALFYFISDGFRSQVFMNGFAVFIQEISAFISVGVGVGGNLEKACLLAKKALLRPIDQPHPDRRIAAREAQLLQDINKLGIGPQGMGGDTTALAVTMEVYPTHIASLPVAVSLNCHSARRAVVTV